MVQNNHKCTRRKAIAFLGTSAVLSSSLGLASARERRPGRAGIVEHLRHLQSEHGSSKVSSISFTNGSKTHVSTNEHESIIAKYKGKEFENCQVETIEYEDGYDVIQVTLIGGRHVETILEGNKYSYSIADEMVQKAAKAREETSRRIDQKIGTSIQDRTQSDSLIHIGQGDALSIGTASDGSHELVGSTNPFTNPSLATHDVSERLAGVAVNGRLASYQGGGYAQVYQSIYAEDWGTLKIGFNGHIRGVILALVAGYDVKLRGFIERAGGTRKWFSIMDRSSILDGDLINQDYSPSNPGPGGNYGHLYRSIPTGIYYVGIELKCTVSTLGPSAAVADFYPSYVPSVPENFCDYNQISVSYI